MKSFLGVVADHLDTEQWDLAVGIWVHEWLREIVDHASAEGFGKLGPELRDRVERAATTFRDEIATMLKRCDRVLPDWWNSTWSNAFYISNCFAGHVAATKGWPAAAQICRAHFHRFGDSLWIWLNKAWIFRFANVVGPKVRKKGGTVIGDFIGRLMADPRCLVDAPRLETVSADAERLRNN